MKKITAIIIIAFIYSQVYPHNRTWVNLAPMPTARYGMCSVVYEDKIWVIGGKDKNDNTLNIVECYLIGYDEWEIYNLPLQTKRFNAAAVVYQDKIYVIGGSDENGKALNTVEYLDLKNESPWQISSNLNLERSALTAVVLNDTIYAIGGGNIAIDVANYLDDVEFWNEEERRWQLSTSWQLYQPRLSMATVVVKGAAYTLGGIFYSPISFVECYHPSRGTELRQSMPGPRYNFAAVEVNDTIFVIGGATIGLSTTEVLVSDIEKYYPEKDEWVSFYTDERILLREAREGLTAVSYYNGIFIFGGRNSTGIPVRNAERLDIGNKVFYTPENIDAGPKEFQLLSNYPNPFNSLTIIPFHLLQNVRNSIRLDIFNINSQIIKSFKWNSLLSGKYQITWNGKNEANQDVTSGVYLYQLSINENKKSVRKMMLIR